MLGALIVHNTMFSCLHVMCVVISACESGSYGCNCSEPCPNGYYGQQCYHVCDCPDKQSCDPIVGCTNITMTTDINTTGKCKYFVIEEKTPTKV